VWKKGTDLRLCKPNISTRLDLTGLLSEDVLAFLKHLEIERHHKTSARHVRLALIQACFHYVATHFSDL
jgi:hypothetical protein